MIPLHDDNPTRRRPVVTILLIAINVGIFLFWQRTQAEPEFLFRNAAIPCEITSGSPIDVVEGRRGPTLDCAPIDRPLFRDKSVYLALLTSMFLHANWLHIGGNMLFLWVFGNNVEDAMGHLGFIGFYLAAGLAAAMAHILLFPGSPTPVVGASGAIAGCLGAYLVRFPRARVLTLVPLFFFFTVWLPAWLVLGVWFLSQFGISASNSGVATAAHIGGFVFGAIVGVLFLRRSRPAPPDPWRQPSPWRAGY